MKLNTVLSYLPALKSYYINRWLSLKGFDNFWMALIIEGRRRLIFGIKRNRLPITKDMLKKIIEDKPLLVTDLNIDTTFKMTWTGFMKIGELTYTATEAKKATFADTSLTRSDNIFVEDDQYTILCLK